MSFAARGVWTFGQCNYAAADFKNYQENNWHTDVSTRAGVEFEDLQVLCNRRRSLLSLLASVG
ncbi:MAG: DUF1207 domain-containing protein [Nitrosomonas sp.]|nr:DUF1207 domain-containing protein [Nitrosomonas sp.]MBP6076951.1 DUF1207 domain-containing protein [Nitrosomonas sp.]